MDILIAGGDAASRRALGVFLWTKLAVNVVAEATDGPALLSLAKSTRVQLVLLDGTISGITIPEAIASLHDLDGRPDVIVLDSRPDFIDSAMSAGADAVVWKVDSPRTLLTTMERLRLRRGNE